MRDCAFRRRHNGALAFQSSVAVPHPYPSPIRERGSASRLLQKTYPRPPNLPYYPLHLIPEGRPSGGMSYGGVGAAPAAGFAPRTREVSGTDLGTLRSLREELARWQRDQALADIQAATTRRGLLAARIEANAPRTRKRGPGSLKSPMAERHGACGGGSILRAASWLNGSGTLQPRLAALRCPSSFERPRENAGGVLACACLPPSRKGGRSFRQEMRHDRTDK